MANEVTTAEEVKAYLGIDYSDSQIDANISRLISTADAYLRGSIGDSYPSSDPRAKELALIIISDLYDNRGLNNPTTLSGNTRRLVDDLSLQLRLELRRATSNG